MRGGPPRGSAAARRPVRARPSGRRAVARLVALCLALVLASGAARADLPAGDGYLSYQLRTSSTDDPTITPRSRTEQDLGLFLKQQLPNYGTLLFEGHRADSVEPTAHGWVQLGVARIPTGAGKLGVFLGDGVFEAGLLPRVLPILIQPALTFEGARLDVLAGTGTSLTLFGGEAIGRAGGFATAVRRTGQDAYGARLARSFGPGRLLSALYLHTDGADGSAGYQHPYFGVFLDLRRNWTTSSATGIEDRTDDYAFLRVTVPVRWGTPLPPPAAARPGQTVTAWGTIAGEVFVDVNGNGIREATEVGMPGLRAVLDGNKALTAMTDDDGRFTLDRVAAGPHTVQMEVKKLPAEYDLVSPQLVEVEVTPRGTVRVIYRAEPLGRIAGRIRQVAVDPAGRERPIEERPTISMLLRRRDEVWQTYAGQDGSHAFDNVRGRSRPAGPSPSASAPPSRRSTSRCGRRPGRSSGTAPPRRRRPPSGAATASATPRSPA